MSSPVDIFVSALVYIPDANRHIALASVPDVVKSMKQCFRSFEVILVNDSREKISLQEIGNLKNSNIEHVILLELAYHHGVERAMTAGADLAVGDFVIEFDYPLIQFPLEIPGKLYEIAARESADIVALTGKNGSRPSSIIFYGILRRILSNDQILKTEAVRLVSRRALNRVLKERRRFRFRKVLYQVSGFRYHVEKDITIKIKENVNQRKRFRMALDILTSVARLGSALSSYLSVVFILISIAVGVYSIIVRLSGLPISEGWTTIMLFLSIGFAGLFTVLFLASRTIEMILDEVQNADPYTVREVIRLDNK